MQVSAMGLIKCQTVYVRPRPGVSGLDLGFINCAKVYVKSPPWASGLDLGFVKLRYGLRKIAYFGFLSARLGLGFDRFRPVPILNLRCWVLVTR